MGKEEKHREAPWRKRSIQEVDARIEMKEKFRNVGFRKVRAPLEMTLAREFKVTATSCHSFRAVKAETKLVCGHC